MITAKISAKRFGQQIDKLSLALERAVVESLDRAERAAFDSMKGTRTFRDRTESLRSAFWAHGEGLDERVVEIDEQATNPVSKTPPNTYGRFLNFGTSRIDPRGFGEAALERAESILEHEIERRLARALGGSPDAGGPLESDEQ